MTTETTLLSIFPALWLLATLLAASATDITAHRIPNVLIVPALLVGIVAAVLGDGVAGLLYCLGGVAVGMAMLMPLYAMGAMGAGDVKLLGVAGAFLGPFGALVAGLATFIVGAVYGAAWMAWRWVHETDEGGTTVAWYPALTSLAPGVALWLGSRLRNATPGGRVAARQSNPRDSTFAYAPAIAIGTLIAMWYQDWPISFALG